MSINILQWSKEMIDKIYKQIEKMLIVKVTQIRTQMTGIFQEDQVGTDKVFLEERTCGLKMIQIIH